MERKRSLRSIPGPAGLTGKDNDSILVRGEESKSRSRPVGPNAKIAKFHFSTPAWQALCTALHDDSGDMPKVIPIREIIEGDHDLDDNFRIKRIACVIDKVTQNPDLTWSLSLIDPTTTTESLPAYMSNEVASLHPALLIAGSAVVLDKATIFVTKNPFQRVLNIHKSNVLTVFPNSPIFDASTESKFQKGQGFVVEEEAKSILENNTISNAPAPAPALIPVPVPGPVPPSHSRSQSHQSQEHSYDHLKKTEQKVISITERPKKSVD